MLGLKSKDDHVREHTAQVLNILGYDAEEAVPALIEALNDKVPAVRGAVASALRGTIGAGQNPQPLRSLPVGLVSADNLRGQTVLWCAQ